MADPRILILSNRDPEEAVDEPPLLQRVGSGRLRIGREDGSAVAAESVLATLAATPGVRVAHRPVLRPNEVLAAIGDHRPDVIVNLCEALDGDSRHEVMCAWLLAGLELPFTGSDHVALRSCLHKAEANRILARAGVRVPQTVRVEGPDHLPEVAFPAIVKPEREDGSTGIDRGSVVHDRAALRDQVAAVVAQCRQPVVVQRYVHGRELSVSLLGWPVPRVLPPGEIAFQGLPEGHPHVVTYEAKWRPETAASVGTPAVAAVLRPLELRRVVAIGRRAFEVLGLRDYGRVDVRLDERGTPYVIDVNPNCDLSPDAGFARAAARAGLSYADVLWAILRSALGRSARHADLLRARGRAPAHAARGRAAASSAAQGGLATAPEAP
ncbi:D-alanine--D-alanine ligase [Sorangium cellulosum]|uniref:D-alanine--D-alanine ligase n=1 Tax=Sorangium cellulosum TaxID=56 RepID=A0A2L0ER33_SORCE|nr:D-alanine--D-alanine ligase [Sorangium cellulosum]AUX41763.1 D-alanine--D-alanine ligase [Sorangium cellulosum]